MSSSVSKFDTYTTPHIDKLLDQLDAACIFDLGFNHRLLAASLVAKVQGKMAFSTMFGLHQLLTFLSRVLAMLPAILLAAHLHLKEFLK